MNSRIKVLRKHLDLTQEEFSSRIGLSRNFIAQIETGTKKPSDRTISDICREFKVNEAWLRTGEGGDDNMFTKLNPEDRFSINLGKLGSTENKMAQNMINAIAEADPEKLEYIEEFMRACLGLDSKEKS